MNNGHLYGLTIKALSVIGGRPIQQRMNEIPNPIHKKNIPAMDTGAKNFRELIKHSPRIIGNVKSIYQ